MKFLILGSIGMAGHVAAAYLTEQGHQVYGFARQESPCCAYNIVGDAADIVQLKSLLQAERFDCVVNGIGILNRGVDEDISRGIYINSLFPHLLADLTVNLRTKLIHISTDCVFSGKKGYYTEHDVADEVSLYGRTKSLGEVIDNKNLTIRTSIVGPELKAAGIGLFHWFMNQRGPVSGYNNVLWSGVTTLELAKAIENVAADSLCGLYHLSNNQAISKYELLSLFNTYCRKNQIEIIPDGRAACNKSIISTREDFSYRVPAYESMIREMAGWIRSHPGLYAEYEGKL